MRMLRRCLALLLAATLVLGWTGAAAAGGCAPTAAMAETANSAAPGGCGTCDDGAGGQPQQGCMVLACAAACAAGPVLTSASALQRAGATAARETAWPPADRADLRTIRPDIPPPR
jgi:hypothetical protein